MAELRGWTGNLLWIFSVCRVFPSPTGKTQTPDWCSPPPLQLRFRTDKGRCEAGSRLVCLRPALPLTGCVTLGKWLNFPGPRFPHLSRRANTPLLLGVECLEWVTPQVWPQQGVSREADLGKERAQPLEAETMGPGSAGKLSLSSIPHPPAGRETRHPLAQWVPPSLPQALAAHLRFCPQPPRQARTLRASRDGTGVSGPAAARDGSLAQGSPGQAVVGASDQVGTAPGLPRLLPLPTRPVTRAPARPLP